VYVFDIIEKPKGALPGDIAYAEAPKPSLEPATSFDAVAPEGAKALLQLRFALLTAIDEPSLAPPDPLPAGAPLPSFTRPQAFLIECLRASGTARRGASRARLGGRAG
jgi:hypothetical protein